MARALIVGCGCRGRALAQALTADRLAVRGTTRRPGGLAAIEASGAEAVLADPDHLGTVMPHLHDVSVICWLMGTAEGPPDAVTTLNGPRLESLLEAIVDTPVRGLVYEAAGAVRSGRVEGGEGAIARTARTHRIPLEPIASDPRRHAEWLAEATAAVACVLER